ncbi:hypothetical protein JO972_07290 [Verrucomicrobiaceae bacterium 5K15]|uniref:RiboL-PSP-HEPN domain-containing protein n=1 Tax=Oceaniferula flava TaxID=2800421 RepID=A0AAE2V820_9BACT|nr:MAE_28990/MAE_18760 family HEPN-like nuclease [Oceaniferula flavus]MBK1854757.1 hypothetical protein [Oceaniferula flavus]MBM1136063.1 hypothetical protein [Oceaniferula flavus]
MSKPYSEADLSQLLTDDRTWRIREISDLKGAICRADAVSQRVLLRGLVAICYAHWEGYVRNASTKFLEHIALRKFKYDQLERQFTRNRFLPRLANLVATKGGFAERCELVDAILDCGAKRFSRVNADLINTKSNLNYEVFSDICNVCGVSMDGFSVHETFIDILLLKRRNSIAHGEDTFIAIDDLDEVAATTIELMRQFSHALENQACARTFLSTP